MYDKDEERRRRELEVLKAKEAKLREELASLNKETRSAKSRLASTTKHENWHARRLAALDIRMGYDGDMASARIYIRSLSLDGYLEALRPYVLALSGADNLTVEIAAVRANSDDWHRRGEKIVLEWEREAAKADRASWETWQRNNPDANGWRAKPMTRRQYFLVSRTADFLGIAGPVKMSRGEASDWLDKHGANLRLARDVNPDTTQVLGADQTGEKRDFDAGSNIAVGTGTSDTSTGDDSNEEDPANLHGQIGDDSANDHGREIGDAPNAGGRLVRRSDGEGRASETDDGQVG